jgi:hypothetical protein
MKHLIWPTLFAAMLLGYPCPVAVGHTREQGWSDLPRDARLRA